MRRVGAAKEGAEEGEEEEEEEEEEGYELEYEEETFDLGEGGRFHVRTVSELPLEVLAQLEEHQDEISGQRVWTGSLFACAVMLTAGACNEADGGGVRVRNRRILELGAGSGVVSMCAAACGAQAVLATDGDARCMLLLRENVARNEGQEEARFAAGVLRVAELRWGDAASEDALVLPEAQTVTDSHNVEGGVDLVVAGDVLYKQELLPLFFGTLCRFMPNRHIDESIDSVGDGADEQPLGLHNCAAYICHIPRAGVLAEHVCAAADEHGLETCVLRPQLAEDSPIRQLPFIQEHCPDEELAAAACICLRRRQPLTSSSTCISKTA